MSRDTDSATGEAANRGPGAEDGEADAGGTYTRDPKDIVTETAFRVDRHLLGTPVASPWRRLTAILIDLTVIGTLILFKEISVGLFAIALAWIMWRIARPEVDVHLHQAWLRGLLRVAAVITFLSGFGMFLSQVLPDDREDRGDDFREAMRPAALSTLEGGMRGLGLGAVAEIATSVYGLQDVDSLAAARRLSGRAALALYRSGASRDQVEDALEEILSSTSRGKGWEDSVEAVVEGAMVRVDSARAVLHAESDSLMNELVAAASAGDTARAEELREEAVEAAARGRVQPLAERVDRLEDQLEEARSAPGIVSFLRQLLDDLGFGFGWLAFYFTAFLKLWQGHTPGKRLLGLRVVKVRGGPIGWWDAFSRFGGYAASVATGLVGFAQVFWDPNRQGLHDRIAGTVVIRE